MSCDKKKISILGSTGSIGVNALSIIGENPDKFEVLGLAAGKNVNSLARQALKFRPPFLSIGSESDVLKLRGILKQAKGYKPEILSGEQGTVEIARLSQSDVVLSAIVGAAALKPTYAAIKKGKRIALANKESIVMAGKMMLEEARRTHAEILPVDSEHSAIFQSMQGHNRSEIKRLILTASGGPFLGKKVRALRKVNVAQALKHPNWRMGAKITIDSATLMNKALEIMEARWLFDVSPKDIWVMIHPQSIVHSIVEYNDGSMISQMGLPDMRVPISYALTYPQRIYIKKTHLNLEKIGKLTFSKPDYRSILAVKYAYKALEQGDSTCVALNAANEACVNAFLCGRIGFLDILKIVGTVLNGHRSCSLHTIDDALGVHDMTIKQTEKLIEGC